MSVGVVTGLFGKLPAHGDFIRRGGPPVVLAALDGWLDAELGRVAMQAPHLLDDGLASLDDWRFAADIAGHRVIGALVASHDKVGRDFPLIAIRTGEVDRAMADPWCEAATGLLAEARDHGLGADDALAALSTIPVGRQPEPGMPEACPGADDALPLPAAPASGGADAESVKEAIAAFPHDDASRSAGTDSSGLCRGADDAPVAPNGASAPDMVEAVALGAGTPEMTEAASRDVGDIVGSAVMPGSSPTDLSVGSGGAAGPESVDARHAMDEASGRAGRVGASAVTLDPPSTALSIDPHEIADADGASMEDGAAMPGSSAATRSITSNEAPPAGWWRHGGTPDAAAALPTGPAFDRLFGGVAA